MDPQTFLSHLRIDGAALAAAARAGLDAVVPSCPEWRVRDLVRHTAQVYQHKAGVIEAGGIERPEVDVEDGPQEDAALVAWYEESFRRLVAVLEARDPGDRAWTFYGDKRVGFWHRRMAQETAVHRWDVEAAAGNAQPIDPELATDGIDEMLRVMIPADEIPYQGRPGTIHLHRTDGGGEWLVTLEPGALPATRSRHEKGDAALRATASDLLLLVWRRLSPSAVEQFGDRELVADFHRYLAGPGL